MPLALDILKINAEILNSLPQVAQLVIAAEAFGQSGQDKANAVVAAVGAGGAIASQFSHGNDKVEIIAQSSLAIASQIPVWVAFFHAVGLFQKKAQPIASPEASADKIASALKVNATASATL